MNTCGTCKHFGGPIVEKADDGAYYTAPGAPSYQISEEQATRYHVCQIIKHTYGGRNRFPGLENSERTAPAFVGDGSGYFAALCVSEEFGCNQWSPK